MKNKSKNHSLFFRGTLLALALALTILCFPFNIISLVKADTISTDYSFMTVSSVPNQSTTITKGKTYKIANAYIGGNNAAVVGMVDENTILSNGGDNVTLKSSSVKVTYSSVTIGAIENGASSDGVTLSTETDHIGEFVADKEGSYTITYSYTFEDDAHNEYTNKYSVYVTTEITSASIDVATNSKYFLPSVIDLSKKTGDFKVYLPLPEVKDENGDVVDAADYTLTDDETAAKDDKTGDYLVVSAVASNGQAVELEYDNDAKLYYFNSSVFTNANFGAGKYTIGYAFYNEGNFLTSTTKSTMVYAANNAYYSNYELKVDLASSMPTSLDRGLPNDLPAAKGVTASTSTPASESVDVYYTTKVYFKVAGGTYEILNADEYNEAYNAANGITDKTSADYETILNADGTLVNPTSFTPMKDGSYSFVYEVEDYYGNKASNTIGLYEFKDVADTIKPTPVIYDASESDEDDYIDASSKFASNAVPGDIVVYAIGMTDNVSKAGDEGVVLERRIVSGDSTEVVSIKTYNDKNLVFNYGNYETLTTNNYLIRKAASAVTNDEEMLTYLKDNNYMIVVDNANYKHIYDVFADVIGEKSTDADKLAYFKTEDAKTAGFAFIDMEKTFGSVASGTNGSIQTTTKGVGARTYTIHYVATDAAENTAETNKTIDISTSYVDSEAPVVKFSTQLAGSYLNGKTITFNVPTATDNKDSRIVVKTLYRFMNGTTNVDAGDVDLADVYNDLTDAEKTKYAKYNGEGYIDLTDAKATTYSIELNSATANKLQIVAYSYDDAGNVGVYAQEILISNVLDTAAPQLVEAVRSVETLAQGSTAELPTIVVDDDKASYLTPNVEVVYLKDNGTEEVMSVYGTTPSVYVESNGFGTYTLNAGKFDASYAGTYQARVAVKDYNGNTIVVFQNFVVDSRITIKTPTLETTLSTSQEVEIDKTTEVEVPVPTIDFELDNSVIYDEKDSSTAKYIVRGVDADGRATNYTTNAPTQGDRLIVGQNGVGVGTYTIKYVATLEVYNREVFSYQEKSYGVAGGFFKFGDHEVKFVDGAYEVDETYRLYKDEDNTIVLTKGDEVYTFDGAKFVDDTDLEITFPTADADLATMNTWFDDLRVYKLESKPLTIEVKDTIGPSVKDSTFNYSAYTKGISVDELKTNGIKIKSIEATDASGIDTEKSQIVITGKIAGGSTRTDTYSIAKGKDPFKAIEDFKGFSGQTKYDGTYTIAYSIYDKQGNLTSKSFSIAVGDNQEPTVVAKDGFVENSYELGSQLVINTNLLDLSDNKTSTTNLTTTIKLVNTSKNNEEVSYTKEGTTYTFTKFEQVGTYTLTIEVEDEVGNKTTKTFSIDVTEKKTDSVKTYKIVGIVLIVVSVLILAGVIVYFIVSKVKLDKELKK